MDIDYRELLLQLLASLTLCDHMGDVADDVDVVLKKMGLDVEWGDWSDLTDYFASENITTLYGTGLGDN